jgi:hypothetical protein
MIYPKFEITLMRFGQKTKPTNITSSYLMTVKNWPKIKSWARIMLKLIQQFWAINLVSI